AALRRVPGLVDLPVGKGQRLFHRVRQWSQDFRLVRLLLPAALAPLWRTTRGMPQRPSREARLRGQRSFPYSKSFKAVCGWPPQRFQPFIDCQDGVGTRTIFLPFRREAGSRPLLQTLGTKFVVPLSYEIELSITLAESYLNPTS